MSDKGKDSVGIIIKAAFTGSYFCTADNIKLHLQDKETGEYFARNVMSYISLTWRR